jgi:hypothetical protein
MMRGLNHPRYGGEPDSFDYTKAVVLSLRVSEESVPPADSDDETREQGNPEIERSVAG